MNLFITIFPLKFFRNNCGYTFIKINISEYNLERGGKGKIAVFLYIGSADPKAVLDEAVRVYVGTKGHHQFVDIHHDNPWTRVVMSDINGMAQKDFDKDNDRM